MHQLPPDLPLGLVELLLPVLDGEVDELVIDEARATELVGEALEDSLAFGTVRVRIADGSIRGEARSLLVRSPPVVVTPVLGHDGRVVLHARSPLPVRRAVAKAQRRCDAIVAVLAEQGRGIDCLAVGDGRIVVVLTASPSPDPQPAMS